MQPLTAPADRTRLETDSSRWTAADPCQSTADGLCGAHRPRCWGALLAGVAVVILAFHLPRPLHAAVGSSPVMVSRATEILEKWQPGQHLFVKGDLGVGQPQLSQLAGWIADHAPHWTVVLIESAADEKFTDAAGESFAGMDAVEHALGKGLPNRTAFGELTDPRTGERNGAFLVIFLKERKFSYFASEAHDRRALGEGSWVGRLDQPAIAAMRDGGRIVDAVKDTVTHIEDRLTRAITAEQAERERQETAARLARQRELEQTRASLASAAQAIELLDSKARELRQARPELTGALMHPDTETLRADLTAAQQALAADHPSPARTLADTLRQRAGDYIQALEDYQGADQELAAVSARLEQVASHPHGSDVQPALNRARATLEAAQTAHDRADPAYADLLRSAREQAVVAEREAHAAAIRAQRRTQMQVGGFSLALLALLAVGTALNLRRRPRRREALALLDAWSNALGEKSVALVEVVDRAQSILGLSSQDVSTRFAGLTLELGQQAVRDVDEACIMAVCAQRIHRIAEATARPSRLGPRIQNFFGTARYRAAIRQLRDEPIVFRPDERLEVAVRGPKTTHDRLLGSLESYQPFRMAFDELMDAFNQRAGRALTTLDRIHASLSTWHRASSSLDQRIQALQATEQTLAAVDTPPDLFRGQALFSDLLPAARADGAEADQVGVRDPVSALETHLAAAQRKCTDAEALTRIALDFHQETYPALASAARNLAEAKVSSDWIEAAIVELSNRADDLARQASQGPAAERIAQLAESIRELATHAAAVVALDRQRREQAIPTLDTTSQAIAQTRQQLALQVGLDPAMILREPGCDPSDALSQAQEQVAAVKAALDLGDVDAAQNALEAAGAACAAATSLVETTRAAAAQHVDRLAACRAETERLEQSVPAHAEILAALSSTYTPSALLLGQGDPAHPNANGTVSDNLNEVGDHLRAALELTDRAAQVFSRAQILEASALLDQANANQALAGFRLTEISEKQDCIRRTEAANEALASTLAKQLAELQARGADPRTTTQTVQRCQSIGQRLTETEARRTAALRDPFAHAHELAELETALAQADAAAQSDWALHADTERLLQTGANELEVARRLAQKSASDSIVDSASIASATHDLHALSHAHQNARQRLGEPHGDWQTLNAEADRIAQGASQIAGILRHELEAAQAAQAALSTATAQVRAATGFRGALGVAIMGSPGADQLGQARTLLNQGAYLAARRAAEAAAQTAALALAQAQAEQRRRQRAEQERLDRERRQREEAERSRRRAAHSSPFGSSPFGGSSGARRSGFSSGAGAARSAFRSSSGARRSGW